MQYTWFIKSLSGRKDVSLTTKQVIDKGITDAQNADTVVRLLIAWTVFLDDSPLGHSIKPTRTYVKFMWSFQDLESRIIELAGIADELIHTLETSDDGSVTGPFMPQFRKLPIFREYHELRRSGYTSQALWKYILSFLMFGKKLDYINTDLDSIAFRKWKEVETKLSHLVLPPYVEEIKDIVDHILPQVDVEPLLPKFGPGSVAESGIHGIAGKFDSLKFDAKIDRLFFNNLRTHDRPDYDPSNYVKNWDPSCGTSSRTARIKFVRQDVRKSRTICMEPNTYMWAQQHYRLVLEEMIDVGYLKDKVVLKNQQVNQFAAYYGSLTRLVDTIDLSAASDSVSWDLVSRIFPTRILKFLQGTRTSTALTPDGPYSVKKYAPMGSALCFPVQSVVYSSIIIYAARLYYRENGMEIPPLEKLFNTEYFEYGELQPFRVYGDDLVIDTKITDIVIRVLSELGFSINMEKSFTGDHPYRESCGEHYVNGSEVTPILYRVKHYRNKIDPRALDSLIGAANVFYAAGYLSVRRFIVHLCLATPMSGYKKPFAKGNPIPFTYDLTDSSKLHTKQRHLNSHLYPRLRYNENLQKWEFHCVAVKTKVSTLGADYDHYGYSVWMRSAYLAEGKRSDSSDQRHIGTPRDLRFDWRWIPVEY